MSHIVFVCEPDENGVIQVGGRYVNVKKYSDPFETEMDAFYCCACGTYQKNINNSCVLCGYGGKVSKGMTIEEFIEKNKEKIEEIRENYKRKVIELYEMVPLLPSDEPCYF